MVFFVNHFAFNFTHIFYILKPIKMPSMLQQSKLIIGIIITIAVHFCMCKTRKPQSKTQNYTWL